MILKSLESTKSYKTVKNHQTYVWFVFNILHQV